MQHHHDHHKTDPPLLFPPLRDVRTKEIRNKGISHPLTGDAGATRIKVQFWGGGGGGGQGTHVDNHLGGGGGGAAIFTLCGPIIAFQDIFIQAKEFGIGGNPGIGGGRTRVQLLKGNSIIQEFIAWGGGAGNSGGGGGAGFNGPGSPGHILENIGGEGGPGNPVLNVLGSTFGGNGGKSLIGNDGASTIQIDITSFLSETVRQFGALLFFTPGAGGGNNDFGNGGSTYFPLDGNPLGKGGLHGLCKGTGGGGGSLGIGGNGAKGNKHNEKATPGVNGGGGGGAVNIEFTGKGGNGGVVIQTGT